MIFNPAPLFLVMADLVSRFYFESPKKQCIRIRNEGGSRCFTGLQEIDTLNGPVEISDLKVGDMVLTMNEATLEFEYKAVEALHQFVNTKPTIRLKMRDGSVIECTEDHEFYYEGVWHSLKHLLSLKEKSK